MNLHLLRHIIETYTKPGDVILDPMAGCGSILYAAVLGRYVQMIELEPDHIKAAHGNYHHLTKIGRISWHKCIVNGNAAEWQGFTLNDECLTTHIIFSPPYGDTAARERHKEPNTHQRSSVPEWVKTRTDPGFHVDSYGHEFFQIGSMRYASYLAAMAIVYRNCYQALRPGGTMVVVTADFWRNHKRVPLVDHTRQLSERAGFVLTDWWQRDRSEQLTTWGNIRRKQGLPVIDDEDIQVFRKTDIAA